MKFINLKKQNVLMTAGVLLLITISTGQALAEPTSPSHKQCKEVDHMPLPPLAGNIILPPYLRGIHNLSETQKDQIFNITYEQLPKFRNAEKQHREILSSLREIANTSPYDDVKAESTVAKLASIEKEFTLLRIRTDAKIFALLSTEQKQQMKKSKGEFDEASHMPPPFSPINNKHFSNKHSLKTL